MLHAKVSPCKRQTEWLDVEGLEIEVLVLGLDAEVDVEGFATEIDQAVRLGFLG